MPGLNLSAVALHKNITFYRQEGTIINGSKNQHILSLKGIKGDSILIGCHIQNKTECMATVVHTVASYAEGEGVVNYVEGKN